MERRTESGRWLSAQFLSLGVDLRKEDIVRALSEVFPHDGIMERSDAPVRSFEGLEPASGLLSGEVPSSILIEENGASFRVDLLGGQKTGWFLDQRANRAAASAYAGGRRVLDVFCNAGGFGIVCAKKGASQVIAVDSSSDAIASVRDNAALNGVSEKITAVEANAFDYLRELEHKKDKFGLVILDPPAFAKNRAAVESAYRGYKDINLRALRLLEQGGILVTNSCSHWFGRERFETMLEEAARDAGRRLRYIEERGQDLDHPVVSGYGESRYLKCFIVEA
jgi:23S rRNA (cytosine1962-C5)-methyltransferase